MKWDARDTVAVILSFVIVIAILGTLILSLKTGQRLTDQGIDWIGKILLVIIGALTMFIGVNNKNKKS